MHREVSMHESRPEQQQIKLFGTHRGTDCRVCIDYTSIYYCCKSFPVLLHDVMVFWSRLVHADLAMHATLAALGTLPRSVSPWARSATCKPCPMVLVPDSTVHCSRTPARNLHLSSSDHALGPWVGFMYIYCHAMLLT